VTPAITICNQRSSNNDHQELKQAVINHQGDFACLSSARRRRCGGELWWRSPTLGLPGEGQLERLWVIGASPRLRPAC